MSTKSLCQAQTKKKQPCSWYAKPGCNGFCKVHKANVPVREQEIDTERFLNQAEEWLYASPDPSALPFPTKFVKLNLMNKIETILKTVKDTKQYRDKTKKVKFNLEWAFLLGEGTTSALGAKSFETPHNFKPGKGVCLTKVETRALPSWKLKLWDLSNQLITLIDPDFAAGEFVVNYSCMNKPEQYVKKHVDSDDVSHQYAMALGNYKNAALRLYDEYDKVIGDFDYHKKVCKMDGRLPHELMSDGFEGERFCIIWFKSYDHRQTEADPIFATPCYIN
jgi:hypothetical protein